MHQIYQHSTHISSKSITFTLSPTKEWEVLESLRPSDAAWSWSQTKLPILPSLAQDQTALSYMDTPSLTLQKKSEVRELKPFSTVPALILLSQGRSQCLTL